MNRLLSLMPFLVLLSGCAHVARPLHSTAPEIKEISLKIYNIGRTQTSHVGEPIVRVKKYTVIERQNALIGSDLHAIRIPGTHLVFGITHDGRFGGIAASFNYLSAPIHGVNVYQIEPESTIFLSASTQQVLEGYPYQNHELLYSGSSSNDFKLLYREYSLTDLIRPAFSQELTYPISSKSIRFRGYRIELLDVNSESITFRVVAE